MKLKLSAFRRTAGFTLVEVGIAAIIAGMAASITLYYEATQASNTLAHGQVDQMKMVAEALLKYESANNATIAAATPSAPGVGNALAPTVAELKAMGALDANFNPNNFYRQGNNGTYKTVVRTTMPGCLGAACSITGMVYLDTQIVDRSNKPDAATAGEAVFYAGGNGGVSTTANPGTIVGLRSGWTEPNPMGNGATSAQTLAMLVVYTPSGNVGGGGAQTAPLNMNGQPINNVPSVTGPPNSSFTVAPASGQLMFLGSPNIFSPSPFMLANFSNSTFSGNVQVVGTLTAVGTTYTLSGISSGSTIFSNSPNATAYAVQLQDRNGNQNAAASSAEGSLNTNDILLRSVGAAPGTWVSTVANRTFSGSTTYNLSGKTVSALGVHKFCVLAGSTVGPANSTHVLNGSVGSAWTYTASVAMLVAQATCFD